MENLGFDCGGGGGSGGGGGDWGYTEVTPVAAAVVRFDGGCHQCEIPRNQVNPVRTILKSNSNFFSISFSLR